MATSHPTSSNKDRHPSLDLLAKADLSRGLPQSALPDLAAAFQYRTAKAGHTFIHEGLLEERMYLIASGKVRIHQTDKTIAVIEEGSLVGELALLDAGKRTMSASMLSDGELFFIDRKGFYGFMARYPALAQSIIGTVISRYRSLDARYVEQMRVRESELERLVHQRTEELEARNAELLRLQQFKEQFLANMSHEIRTPLNAIVGMSNLMERSEMDESQATYLRFIREAAKNLRVIVDEILDFSKLEAGKMELEQLPFDPRHLADLVVQMLRFKTEEKGLYFRTVVDDSVPAVLLGDSTRLSQVLINLCGNAIKFTEKGGITVGLTLQDSSSDPVGLRFSVADTGIGIKPEHQQKVFEKFAQATSGTQRKFGGTGLGLAISQRIVELHGGKLHLESTFGQGSTFHVDVSLALGNEDQLQDLSAEQAEQHDLGELRILLAEDNDFNVLVAVNTLELELPKATIDVAADGVEALELFAKNHYDLVLMDIQMPRMDGYETTQRIRDGFDAPKRNTPVIAMTANVIKSEVDRCFAVGMNACVSKPFEVADLLGAIHQVLA